MSNRFLLLALVAALAAGCGSVTEEESSLASPRPRQQDGETAQQSEATGEVAEISGEYGEYGELFFVETEPPPVDTLYRVFSRPRTEADRRAAESAAGMNFGLEYQMDEGVRDDERRSFDPGPIKLDEGRLLLDGLGGEDDAIYAAPTANEHVCVVVLPSGTIGCGRPGRDGLRLAWSGSGDSLFVYGLVADAITGVDVIVGDAHHPARLGENAFALRLRDVTGRHLTGVVLHRRDGSSNRLDLP